MRRNDAEAGPPGKPGVRPDPRPAASEVRPYLLTGGRARPGSGLEFEAQVQTTTAGRDALNRYRYEQREIILLCREPLAVVEVAARLGVQFGVARVLVGDLVACGHLTAYRPNGDLHRDATIIERVIRGLRAIR
jgi:hypothetical protein